MTLWPPTEKIALMDLGPTSAAVGVHDTMRSAPMPNWLVCVTVAVVGLLTVTVIAAFSDPLTAVNCTEYVLPTEIIAVVVWSRDATHVIGAVVAAQFWYMNIIPATSTSLSPARWPMGCGETIVGTLGLMAKPQQP